MGRAKLGYAPVIEAYDCYDRLARTLDPQAVKAAVEQAGVVTTSEGPLFELVCLFDMIDALREAGWRIDPLDRTFHGKLTVTGTRPDGRRVVLRYQRTPSNVPDSCYKTIQASHGIRRPQELRPDMVISWDAHTGMTRWPFVECKLSIDDGVVVAARHALNDLLAYRSAFGVLLDDQPQPYSLGLASGKQLAPNTASEITLATPDTLASAVHSIVH